MGLSDIVIHFVLESFIATYSFDGSEFIGRYNGISIDVCYGQYILRILNYFHPPSLPSLHSIPPTRHTPPKWKMFLSKQE